MESHRDVCLLDRIMTTTPLPISRQTPHHERTIPGHPVAHPPTGLGIVAMVGVFPAVDLQRIDGGQARWRICPAEVVAESRTTAEGVRITIRLHLDGNHRKTSHDGLMNVIGIMDGGPALLAPAEPVIVRQQRRLHRPLQPRVA